MHFILVVIVLANFCNAVDLPSFLRVCHNDDPDLELCYINVGEQLRPYLVKGVPEYNIPSIEPLIIDDLINEDSNGLKITANDVSTYGCSDYLLKSVRVDRENQQYESDVIMPKLRIKGKYSVDGKLMSIPIKGSGELEANVSDCASKNILQGEIYQKNGEDYLRFISMKLKIKVGEGKINLSNLLRGDSKFNDVLNETINRNLNPLLKELLPVIERALADVFLNVANKIVEPFTYKQLFPN